MEMLALKYIGMGLVSLGMMGAAIAAGMIFSSSAQGIARNPSAEGAIRKIAILGVVFAEFMGLLSFVLGIMILGGK